jgi:TonB family protein
MDERARGLQGEVTVRYQVHPSGRVRGVTVVRSSGHPSLDALAVAAVPARLPRPPAAARPDGLVYEHTLGYRNPLVLVSPP